MKIIHLFKLARLIIPAAFIAGGISMASDLAVAAAPRFVAKEISMHAPNSPEQTVTVWQPVVDPKGPCKTKAAPNCVAKVVELHAPNSPVQSITVWVAGAKVKP